MGDNRECTCSPDDLRPFPCARKYAYSDCLHEAGRIAGLKEALEIVEGLDLSRLDEAGVHIRSRISSLESPKDDGK